MFGFDLTNVDFSSINLYMAVVYTNVSFLVDMFPSLNFREFLYFDKCI